jgi:hypothetical protein
MYIHILYIYEYLCIQDDPKAEADVGPLSGKFEQVTYYSSLPSNNTFASPIKFQNRATTEC